jgi:hypothetical protein
MTAIDRHPGASRLPGRARRRRGVPLAAATAALLAAGAVVTAGSGSAGAATVPQAQSVGNFLDAAVHGRPLDDLAELAYAHAASPGRRSTQNPLDVTALKAVHLPLTGALQLPKTAGAEAGALNQVAVARASGESYGASGAVLNSGGVSLGGDNDAAPTFASVDLCSSALTGSACGSSPADAIGELELSVGAVAGLARTPAGFGRGASTDYAIADLDLSLTSPLVARVLGTVDSTLGTLVGSLTRTVQGVAGLPEQCRLSAGLGTVTLEKGAVTLDARTGSITIDLDKLVSVLVGHSLNRLPANTDLLTYLLTYLSDPDGLARGVVGVVDGLTEPLAAQFTACNDALDVPAFSSVLSTLVSTLRDGQQSFGDAVSKIADGVVSGLGGADASKLVDPLRNLLKSAVDIGVNVQPNGPAGTFATGLAATPKQGTAAVPGQTIVRAIEIDLFRGGGITPAAARQAADRKTADRKTTDPVLAVALGNAAAGPGAAPAAVTSAPAAPAPGSSVPAANIPTGVPAGLGRAGGTPALPIVLLGVAGLFAAGGMASLKRRNRTNAH